MIGSWFRLGGQEKSVLKDLSGRIGPDLQNSHLVIDEKIIVSTYYLTEPGM